MPLGAVGVRPKIAEYFQQNVFYGGLTYNAHPFCLAVAEAALDVLENEKLVENSRRMGEILHAELDKLQAKHPSIRTHRNIGLFGIVEIQKNRRGERIAAYNQSSPVMGKLSKFFAEKGLYTPVRWDNFMCNPPLCITESELREGIAIIDEGLKITDDAMEA